MSDNNFAYKKYLDERIYHWDRIANLRIIWSGFRQSYHRRLFEVFKFLISPGQNILELDYADGDLLAKLQPKLGIGIDFSSEMIQKAKKNYPSLFFIQADAHNLCLDKKFDVIILSDLLNDLWDVQLLFDNMRSILHPRSRIFINIYSRFWELPLFIAKQVRLSKPLLQQNWLTIEDIKGLLQLTNYEVIRTFKEVLLPISIPVINLIFNRFLVKFWPLSHFSVANFVVARPFFENQNKIKKPIVSVVVPARNEAGNICEIIERIPDLGSKTETIFVEGHSTDDTYDVIKEAIESYSHKHIKLYQQLGIGKADAVQCGFDHAGGDILMILDADLTVPPEDLFRFYEALISGKGELINGVRLVYPMEKEAMRYLNLIGNKIFSIIFSWLIGQHVKDTLCGTKVLWKEDYIIIKNNRDYFGDFDPFGDFNLLFGAAKFYRRIIDLPIRYR